MSVTRRAFLRQASAAGAALAAGCGGGDGGGDGAPSDALTDASADAAAGDATAWDTAAGDAGGAGARDAAPRDAGSDDLGPAEDAAGPDAEPAEPLPEYSWEGEPGPADLFADGVASGDPLPDSVILWTRLSTEDPGDVALFYEIARDPDFEHRVAAGWDLARADRDHTAKMDPRGLLPGTTWYFRFHAEGRTSPTGRTRTAPAGPTERLRLGVVSCSNITRGYFVAYKELAAMAGLDAVLHLGDYFYETGGSGRVAHDPPHELLTLADYRTRYRQYRRDVDCQEMHRQHAFIPVWDDHETSNDAWFGGADSHNPATDGDWIQRKGWAIQAWHEYMPVRDASDRHIWRAFQFGDLVDLIMLDTRLWGRDHQAQPGRGEDLFADDRTLLGLDQEAWLADTLLDADARWQVLGQQVMFGQLKVDGGVLNPDQWDGYEATRQRVYDAVDAAGVVDLVVLTGDIHTSWANDLCRDPTDPERYDPQTQAGSQGVELVTPGVTSGGLDDLGGPGVLDLLKPFNPHIRWVDVEHRGYLVLDFTHERVQAAWRHFDDISVPDAESHLGAVFRCDAGGQHLIEETEQVAGPADAPPLAP